MTDTTPCARGCEVPGAHTIEHPAGSTCPGCLRRPAMRGTTVCQHCADLFRGALRDLRTAWPDLRTGTARDRTTTYGTGAVQTSRVADVGDQWRPAVAQAIADVTAWLDFVSTALADSPAPGLRGVDLAALTPQIALATLAYSARPILASHPALAEALVGEALRLRGRAHRSLSTSYVRRIPLTSSLAHCLCEIEVDDQDAAPGVDHVRTERCYADLVAILQPADAGGESAILCTRFPQEHRVAASQWGALADELERILT